MAMNKTLQDCITYNNRFASEKLNAEQIGAENLKAWKTLVEALHKNSYDVYCKCECDNATVDTTGVDLSPIFDALRPILARIGEVNGHKLVANGELATLMIGYAGKRGNSDSPELQLTNSMLKNRKAEYREFEKTQGVNPAVLTELQKTIDELEEKRKTLLAEPDNRVKTATRTTASSFRLEVEHRLARLITEQQAKTWAQLEAEAEERRKARRAATKAKKQAKKQAEAEAK